MERDYPYIAVGCDEAVFVVRLWAAMQASGHLLTQDQVRSVLTEVDRSFAPKPVAAQQV